MAEEQYLLSGMLPRPRPFSAEEEEALPTSPLLRSSVRDLDSLRARPSFLQRLVRAITFGGSEDCDVGVDAPRKASLRGLRSPSRAEQDSDLSEHGVFGLTARSGLLSTWRVLLVQASPLIASFLLDVLGDIITLTYAGNYTKDLAHRSSIFAGIALSNVLANVTGVSMMYGMGSVLETVASQHNGARRFKEVGFALQRSVLVLAAMSLFIAPLWYFAGDLCRLAGIDPLACDTAETFLRIRLLVLPAIVLHISFEFYTMAVGVFLPSMYSGVVYNSVLLLINYLSINVYGLGHECLAYSLVFSMYVSVLFQIGISLLYSRVRRTLQRPSWEALNEWGEFVSLGVSATVMLCSEWWAYEIMALMAAELGADSLSAESILIQTEYLAFIFPLCIGYAITSVVGNSLGSGDIALSKLIGKHALYIILVVEVVIGLGVFILSPPWISFIIEDNQVRLIAHNAVPLLSYYAFMDCFQGVASGVLKGAGKQFIGAVLNVISFYVLALPMAAVFGFVFGWGVNGLLMGFCFGTTFQTFILAFILIFKIDYVYSGVGSHSENAKAVTNNVSQHALEKV